MKRTQPADPSREILTVTASSRRPASLSRRRFLGAVALAASAPLLQRAAAFAAPSMDAQTAIAGSPSLEDPTKPLQRTVEALRKGARDGMHIGAQLYVSLRGKPIADFGMGFSRIGVPMTPDSMMVWYSASKPVTAIAIGQQWERGKLELDDPVAKHLPEFAKNGKDKVTLRHVLTHTGGFPKADAGVTMVKPFDEVVSVICDAKLEDGWIPGQRAAYHPTSGWYILGAVVQRVDKRPYSRYVREEVFQPLKMNDCWVGMPADRFTAYGDRIGAMMNMTNGEPAPATAIDLLGPWCEMCVPGANGHGPMHELGRFYETLMNRGQHAGGRLISPQTVEAMTSVHRFGIVDSTFKAALPWGLGIMVDPAICGPYRSPRTFGHGGSLSSMACCDPEHGLVVAAVCNGRPKGDQNITRFNSLFEAIYLDLGLATADTPRHAPEIKT